MRVRPTVLLGLIGAILSACAPRVRAQEAPVSIHTIDDRAFSVHVFAPVGTTEEDAGLMAMEAACRESLSRGFTHMGINEFRMSTESGQQQVSRGGVQYHGGTDGRPVGATTAPDTYRNVAYGRALLVVQLMDAATAEGVNWIQVVDAQSCTVVQ